jgi:VCBS repeat-containing protein
LTAQVVTQPTHGSLQLAADGAFTYRHDGSETTQDHFTYRAHDGFSASNIVTVTVTVQPINDPPVATDDSLTVARGQSATTLVGGATSVLANDPDPDSQTLTAVVLTAPQHGALTLQTNGTFVYTHNGDTALTDSFTYRAVDGNGAADSATVAINIETVRTPEIALAFSKTVAIEGITPRCATNTTIKAPIGTTIAYCYTVRNTGEVTLTTHSLVDSHLGPLLTNINHPLAPGATYAAIFTQTLAITTTNIATWTASTAETGAAVAPLTTTTEQFATVRIAGPHDDSDGDAIPDNVEGAADIDKDNLPNFLDTDADGDDVPDRTEAGADPSAPRDSNDDGIPDYLDAATQPPTTFQMLLPLIYR